MGRRSGGYPGSPKPLANHINGKKTLERISNETGGRMFDVSKEAARNQAVKETIYQIYQKIREDLRNQYSLGYVPDSHWQPLGVPQNPFDHDPGGTRGASQRWILSGQTARRESGEATELEQFLV